MAHIEKKETGISAEPPSELISSENRTPKSLKPKGKISKRPLNDGLVKINEVKGTLKLQGEKTKKKKMSFSGSKRGSSNHEKEDADKVKLRGMKQKNAISGDLVEKRQEIIRTKEKRGSLLKQQCKEKNTEKYSRLEKHKHSQMNKEKHGLLEKGQHNGNRKEKLGGLIFMCNGKTKPDCFRYRVMGVAMSKKDLVLGIKPGLKLFLYDFDLKVMYGIYKASSSGGMKLEPAAFNGAFPVQVRFDVHQDCYPLPESVFERAIKENYNGQYKFKKELTVQQVKKLIKLFRPAEVQSHAPPIHHPPLVATLIHPPPMVATPVRPPPTAAIQDKEFREGARESWAHLHGESLARDPHTYSEGRRYHALSYENNQHATYKEVPREAFSQDHYPNEKEYRTYGLRRVRQNFSPPRIHIAPTLEPYPRGQEYYPSEKEYRSYAPSTETRNLSPPRGHISAPMEPYSRGQAYYPSEKEYRTYGLQRGRQNLSPPKSHITPTVVDPYSTVHVRDHLLMRPGGVYKDAVSASGQATNDDSHLVTENKYQTYSLSSTPLVTTMVSTLDSYSKDPYYTYHHDGSSLDLYQPPSRREEVPLGSYSHSGREEIYPSGTQNLRTRDVYLTQTDQSRKGGSYSYMTQSSQLGRIENNVGMLYSTYASSAPSYYDQNVKYPVAKPETSHALVSSRYSLTGPSLFTR